MRRRDLFFRWIRSYSTLYGIIFVTFIGGLSQILALSDELNYTLVGLLEKSSEGVSLQGNYLYPENWIRLSLVFVCLLLLFPITSMFKLLSQKIYENSEENWEIIDLRKENKRLRQDLDDVVQSAKNITQYMFPDVNIGRWDILSVESYYEVMENGDTYVNAEYVIRVPKQTAHFWHVWIDADSESDVIKSVRDLNFSVRDVTEDRKLDCLPIQNEEKAKKFAIFFPEAKAGVSKRVHIEYRWPGYMRKLVELGKVSFDWKYTSATKNNVGHVKHEWKFAPEFGSLSCDILGNISVTARVEVDSNHGKAIWRYVDPSASMNAGASVLFTRKI